MTGSLTRAAPLNILVLEDVPMDAELLEYELGRAGIAFTARCVGTREAFLHELETAPPDLILSDYSLPGFDGMAALRLARERAPTVPFIVVTGSINEETAVGCMRAGAADYLLKNNLARIGPAIGAALERERARAETRRAEAALRQSEANLRAIFNNTLQDFVLLDLDGVIVTMNKASSDWARWVVGGDLSAGESLIERMPDDIAAEWRGLFERARDNYLVTFEREVTNAEGVARWFEASLIPVVDREAVIGVCLSVVSIDERKRAEDHFRRADRMEAVGRLAGGVAHEVNNMMTVIQGFANFVLADLEPTDHRHGDIQEIIRAADRAASVTRQLLAFSRQQLLQPTVVDLNTVVGGTESMLRRLLGESHELVLRLTPSLGRIKADRSQLEQVMVNLALNARDALPPNGRLTFETMPVMLDEAYVRRRSGVTIPPGPYVMLAISDNGRGMDPATQARIFEPFFTTKSVGQGTGLGLSTAYGIVKQSGGFIWVYSEVGIGTTFKIYLPVVVEPESPAVLPVAPVATAGGSETILVVEDEEMVRDLTCRVLRDHGYTVMEAGNGAEGLRVAERHAREIHLIISDVVMPVMSGRELGERLTTLCPGIPVLYMSGYTGDDVVHRGLLAPGVPFQQKPFTPETIVRRVREMLDLRSQPQTAGSAS